MEMDGRFSRNWVEEWMIKFRENIKFANFRQIKRHLVFGALCITVVKGS
jgi:hypothetical protein